MIPTANQLYAELRASLAPAGDYSLSLGQVEECFNTCNKAVMTLNDLVKEKEFADPQEEIHFFKKIKPRFTSLQRYYILLYNHLLFKPAGHNECIQYFQHCLKALNRLPANSDRFYKYYRSGSQRLDQQYFTRTGKNCVNTTGEILISDRLARKLVVEYIRKELENMRK